MVWGGIACKIRSMDEPIQEKNWASSSVFRLLLPASEPPSLDTFLARFPDFRPVETGGGIRWEAGSSDSPGIAVWCEADSAADSDDMIRWAWGLSEIEQDSLRQAQSRLMVEVESGSGSVLRTRKDALRRAAGLFDLAGLGLIDLDSMRVWTPGTVEDEMQHDADLDIESLYVIHAVSNESGNPSWIHTHGLGALGGFDIDIIEPSGEGYALCPTIIRALGYEMLDGQVVVDEPSFPIAAPGGDVRLVPAKEFDEDCPSQFRDIRDMHDPIHTENRAVLCDVMKKKRFGFGSSSKRPMPASFLRRGHANMVVNFGTFGTDLMTRRAQNTASVMEHALTEFAEFGFRALVKMGYEVDNGPGREHLWFIAHGIQNGTMDGTLINQPFDIAKMAEGDRGQHDIGRVSDWQIGTPLGPITPRNTSLVRLLRTHREEILRSIREQSDS